MPAFPSAWFVLPAQLLHGVTFGLYWSVGNAYVHEVAPVLVPAFVIEPAPQSTQDAMFDAVEYLPATHAVQFVAPAAEPVSVIDPAAHSEQYDLPPSD